MAWSFPIGRLFGSELRVHATFFLILLWAGAVGLSDGSVGAALTMIAFILALFACVVAHEFGHALMARRFGIATPDITLLPIGGLARLERMPERPGQEIAVALAGPAVNVVIWLAIGVVTGSFLPLREEPFTGGTPADFLVALGQVNLVLVVFNLLPAFPMDGGRVLRALLALRMGRVRATRAAAGAGQVMAFLFAFAGLTSGNVMLVVIAVAVFFAAAGESGDVALRDMARHMGVRDAMISRFETLEDTATIADAAAALIRTTQHEFPVLDRDGRLAGFLTRGALYRALALDERRSAPIAPLLHRDIPTIGLRAPLEAALDAMARRQAPAVAVLGSDDAVIGYITPENLGELMIVSGRG